MKIIGITGPTGAGKTTALGELARLGVEIIDCDALYHQLLKNNGLLRSALLDRFGADILDDGGKIDRKKLGGVVFRDRTALAELNAVTHRFVLAELDRRLLTAEREGRRAVAIDAIALIESGVGERCDAVVCVLAPREVRIRRIMDREGISEAYARSRVDAQKDEHFFRAHGTHILENDSVSREEFSRRARKIFEAILSE